MTHEEEIRHLARTNPRALNAIRTPRTDAATGTGNFIHCVDADFARELERENTALQAVAMACKDHDNAFEARIEKLTDALRRALPVLEQHAFDERSFWGKTDKHGAAAEAESIYAQAKAAVEKTV